ncbi:MAG TPA: hypothetical protein PLW75_10725 [Hyphomicrobium sp.]|nr:hypothetical protein [Hyphomicrobium sp.]
MFLRLRVGMIALLALVAADLSGQAHAKCRMRSPDTVISGITLTDSESAVSVVGADAELIENDHDLPHARFVSTNGAEELVLFAPYGANQDEYAEAEVRVAGTEALTLRDLPIESFATGRGVALGMTIKQVEALFGPCVKSRQRNGNEVFIEYEIKDADRDPELSRFSFPLYYAEYEFLRGKLVRFRFGFAYP